MAEKLSEMHILRPPTQPHRSPVSGGGASSPLSGLCTPPAPRPSQIQEQPVSPPWSPAVAPLPSCMLINISHPKQQWGHLFHFLSSALPSNATTTTPSYTQYSYSIPSELLRTGSVFFYSVTMVFTVFAFNQLKKKKKKLITSQMYRKCVDIGLQQYILYIIKQKLRTEKNRYYIKTFQ